MNPRKFAFVFKIWDWLLITQTSVYKNAWIIEESQVLRAQVRGQISIDITNTPGDFLPYKQTDMKWELKNTKCVSIKFIQRVTRFKGLIRVITVIILRERKKFKKAKSALQQEYHISNTFPPPGRKKTSQNCLIIIKWKK